MIEINNVSFSRNDGDQRQLIIDNLSLSLKSGEQLALLGDSGSGKTTLLNILAGLLLPNSGSVIVNGESIEQYSSDQLAFYRRKIGLIFQHYQLLDCLTVKQNILFQHHLNGRHQHHSEFEELVGDLGLVNKLNAFPEQLSGGEQQRVGIARAILNQPKLILADEPTGNLDQARSHQVVKLMTQLCKERNINLVMVTHSQQLTTYFDRVAVLKSGRIDE